MYGTFFLGKNPNGKFFVTNNAESVAQQIADETGVEIHEIVDKNGKLSLKKCVLESGAEKVADAEVKTLVVDGKPVKVQTTTQAVKKIASDEAKKNEREKSAAVKAREKRHDAANAAKSGESDEDE